MPAAPPTKVLVFVIGSSGAGCSTFINIAATGSSPGPVAVSSGKLASVTKSVTVVPCTHPRETETRTISLVDVPALDCGPDPEVALESIKNWFEDEWSRLSEDCQSVVLFLQRITDSRAESPQKQVEAFKRLFPYRPPRVSVLVTTMWNGLMPQRVSVAEQRHEDMTKAYSAAFGSEIPRFDRTHSSAWTAIDLALSKLRSTVSPEQPSILIEPESVRAEDLIIAVMGPTGSGKSTFVKVVTGLEGIVGHSLESCTTGMSAVKTLLEVPGVDEMVSLVFLDTPSFDIGNMSDVDVLKLISDWLKMTYEKDVRLSGILYFHRVSDNHMAGTSLKNLNMFKKLCGEDAFSNVTFVTTMWDEVYPSVGQEREDELKKEYWRPMIANGARCARFLGTPDCVQDIVRPLISVDDGAVTAVHQSVLQIQRELVDERKALPDTQAGRALYSELEAVVERQQQQLHQLRASMEHGKLSRMEMRTLMAEYEQARVKASRTLQEMQTLKLPRSSRHRPRLWDPWRLFS